MGGVLHHWLVSVPLFPVVFGAGLVFSAAFSRPLSARSGLPGWLVFGLLASLGLVVAATLAPADGGAWGSCLSDVLHPLGPQGLLAGDERALNTWLFVPLGLFAGLAARDRGWLLPAAFAVPFVVEGIQRLSPWLDRRCQFQDLVDNTWGLVLGAAVGLLIGMVGRRKDG